MPEKALKTLWLRMAAIYGHRWISNYGSDPAGVAGETWRAGLAGMTGEQLAEGLRGCALSGEGWPPTLPEFRLLCFRIPSFEEVSVMLKPGAPELSPFARLVYANLDPYELRQADARTARLLVRGAYQLATEHVLHGGALPGPVERIEHDPSFEERLYRDIHDKKFGL